MSLEKVEMFTVVCDNCKKNIGSEQDYSCWNDDTYAEENAMESDWEKVDDKHYCTYCYSYDDDDNFILNKELKDKYLLKE